MIPRLKPCLGWRELVAALSPPRRDDVERFEQAFASEMGQKYAVAFPYGRTGLIVLLEALGLKNKEIICPAYTCVVVPHAIVFSGNTPVFVDSQEDDFNMNIDLLPDVITDKIGAPTAPIEDQVAPYLRGVYEYEGQLLVVLNLDKLLRSTEMQQFETN